MGVKDLWTIISPVCEKKSLWELEKKVIAIDLSAWICDSQTIYCSQGNMYLRNIFFRTSYLLLLGAKPIFIMEGKAPDLKVATIRKRLKKDADVNEEKKEKHTRTRLSALQKQCMDLLSTLGVPCVKGPGEAEAYCAHLNKFGIVDGVITQDSDVFLYGARNVFRNFQMSPNYTYDCYSMDVIEEKLGLSRKKLIGLSLLLGSDYNNSIQKLGKDDALKFILSLPDNEIIQRFVNWRNDSFFESIERTKFMNKNMSLEMKIREKCIRDDRFPDLEVVTEYTSEPSSINFKYEWLKPNLAAFVGIAVKKLNWEEDYAVNKFLPLVCRWHLLNHHAPSDLRVSSILGVPVGKYSYCYKVKWDKYDLTTTEPKELVHKSYPQLTAEFEASRNNKKRKTTKKSKPKSVDAIGGKRDEEDKRLEDETGGMLVAENDSVFDLSLIIADIVSRPESNPALARLT